MKDFFDPHKDNAFERMHIATNLKNDKPPVTKEAFWEVLISCLDAAIFSSFDGVHTTTCRAFTAVEMDKIIAKVHVG